MIIKAPRRCSEINEEKQLPKKPTNPIAVQCSC